MAIGVLAKELFGDFLFVAKEATYFFDALNTIRDAINFETVAGVEYEAFADASCWCSNFCRLSACDCVSAKRSRTSSGVAWCEVPSTNRDSNTSLIVKMKRD